MVEATEEQFGELTREGLVLVDIWGPRCAPCLALMPHVAKLEEEHGGAFRVVKVNSAENRAHLSRAQGVRASRPTSRCAMVWRSSGSPVERSSSRTCNPWWAAWSAPR